MITKHDKEIDRGSDPRENIESRLKLIEQKLDLISLNSNVYKLKAVPALRADDEVDIRELWNAVWLGKWTIVATTFVFALLSVFFALSLPNIYKSEALLAPAGENSGGGLAGLAGQFGGLASLAGVNLGGGGREKTTLAIEVLKSRDFISRFIQKHDLLIPLMAAEGWDRDRGELIIDPDIYDINSKVWVREVDSYRSVQPTMQEAYEKFVEKFSVSQDKQTNFVLLSFEFFSPSLTKAWIDLLVQEINLEIKLRDVAEAETSILYLTEQLEKTSIADMQSVFYELIEEQSKTVMFAEVREEYVFKTIDPAVMPEEKDSPPRALICIAATLLGGFVGVLFVLGLYFFSQKTSSRKAREGEL